jgi:hypothetical protein
MKFLLFCAGALAVFFVLKAAPSQGEANSSEGVHFGVELRLELYESEIYLKTYCKIQSTCVLTVDDIQLTLYLDTQAYQVNILDATHAGALHSKNGTSTFFLVAGEQSLVVDLFSSVPEENNRAGQLMIRRMSE